MLRTFEQHVIRPVMSLDGLWDFVTAADRKDAGRLPKKFTRQLYVPSAWETVPGLEHYRGTAFLRRTIPGSDHHAAARLVFGGVSHTGTVYVDGKKVGRHYDAFTPWDAVVPNLGDGEHELVVEVDNSFGEHSVLHKENDYFTYGGITRPAELQLVDAVYIDKIFAAPIRRGKLWDLDLRICLRSVARQPLRRSVTALLDEVELNFGEVVVKPGGMLEIAKTFKGLRVSPWSAEKPRLYMLHAMLLDGEEVADDLIDRVAFREIQVRGKKLLLNGKPLRLWGYNRHEDHGHFGCAIPVEAMMTDLELLRDMGANFIRTCHYPNDMRFLDLCDELGMYVWEESHARTVDLRHKLFRRQIADSTTEMIEWHYNHPSILMWACLNECESDSRRGRREFEYVLKLMKSLDPTRPVTFASNRHVNDLCLDLVDIVSWNRYDAWYGTVPEAIAPKLDEMLKWLHGSKKSGGAGKPVIMSEFGAAGLYGCRMQRRPKWSEEYQADVLDESLRVYMNYPDVVGVAIWQFCDCRITDGDKRWATRPRTMNNKGTVDEYRRPKLAYEVVKKHFRRAARRGSK